MSNALYDHGRQGFLDGSFNWSSSAIRAALVSSGYTVNLATDTFLSDIPGGAIIATSASFTSKTATAGVAAAANTTFSAVAGPTVGHFVVIYYDTGTPASSRLIAYIDTATGMPVTPNGGDITIAWDTGSNKIFKL